VGALDLAGRLELQAGPVPEEPILTLPRVWSIYQDRIGTLDLPRSPGPRRV
jgi:hypothetical protein